MYTCRANVIKHDSIDEKTWELDISQPSRPVIEETNLIDEVTKHSLGEPLQLRCKYSGIPRPEIHWYKDNQEIVSDKQKAFRENNTILEMRYITIEDEGKYKCKVSNRLGVETRETSLKIKSKIKWKIFQTNQFC